MSIRDDLIAVGIAVAVVAGAAWYAKNKLEEMAGAAGKAINDTIFGEGQDINSTIPLYNMELKTRPDDYDPGDINNGAVF